MINHCFYPHLRHGLLKPIFRLFEIMWAESWCQFGRFLNNLVICHLGESWFNSDRDVTWNADSWIWDSSLTQSSAYRLTRSFCEFQDCFSFFGPIFETNCRIRETFGKRPPVAPAETGAMWPFPRMDQRSSLQATAFSPARMLCDDWGFSPLSHWNWGFGL